MLEEQGEFGEGPHAHVMNKGVYGTVQEERTASSSACELVARSQRAACSDQRALVQRAISDAQSATRNHRQQLACSSLSRSYLQLLVQDMAHRRPSNIQRARRKVRAIDTIVDGSELVALQPPDQRL